MNRADTMKILTVLKAAYPNFYKSMSREELTEIVDLWQTMFQDDDPQLVSAAVKAFIATDTKGFPPVIGVIKDEVRKISKPPMMTGQEAWDLVCKAMNCPYDEMDASFNSLPPMIRSVVGSSRTLRDWAMTDADEVHTVVSALFQKSYLARAKDQQDYDALPGDVKELAAASMLALGGAVYHEV